MSEGDTRTREAFDRILKASGLIAAIRKVVTDPLVQVGLEAVDEQLLQVIGLLDQGGTRPPKQS